MGLLHAGRDGPGPASPRVLAALRPQPSQLPSREPLRDGVPGLLPVPGQRAGVAARVAPGRRRGHRDVRPWGPDDGRRGLLQRLAGAGGLPQLRRAGDPAHRDRQGPDRLEQDRGLGRRGVLRAAVPEREGPRAERRGRAIAVRGGPGRAVLEPRSDAGSGRNEAWYQGLQAAGRLSGGILSLFGLPVPEGSEGRSFL